MSAATTSKIGDSSRRSAELPTTSMTRLIASPTGDFLSLGANVAGRTSAARAGSCSARFGSGYRCTPTVRPASASGSSAFDSSTRNRASSTRARLSPSASMSGRMTPIDVSCSNHPSGSVSRLAAASASMIGFHVVVERRAASADTTRSIRPWFVRSERRRSRCRTPLKSSSLMICGLTTRFAPLALAATDLVRRPDAVATPPTDDGDPVKRRMSVCSSATAISSSSNLMEVEKRERAAAERSSATDCP